MRFLSQRESFLRRRESSYRVRVFDPRGLYPLHTLSASDSFYSANTECIYTVVLGKSHDQVESELPYSEMDWATPEELRFWASILLCEDSEGPLAMLYPSFTTYILSAERLDLRDKTVQDDISRLLAEEARAPIIPRLGGSVGQCWNAGYNVFCEDYHAERQPQFYSSISTEDHCLLRGISCLIKCDMLSRHYEFSEEAGLVAFIALDASYSLVRDLLKKQGIKSPSARDAGKWLDDTFNRPIGLEPGERKYFEEAYDQRIMTFHPASRFGTSLYAPFIHDDYMMLRHDLREIFAYLVLSEHGPEMQRRIKHHGIKS